MLRSTGGRFAHPSIAHYYYSARGRTNSGSRASEQACSTLSAASRAPSKQA